MGARRACGKKKVNIYQALKCYILNFSLLKFCRKITPTNDNTYITIGLYFTAFSLTTMYGTPLPETGATIYLVQIIYPLMLVTGTLIAAYPLWPSIFTENIKQKIILIWYPLSIFYMLIFFSFFFIALSEFKILQLLLLAINLIIATLLLGWRAGLVLNLIGFYLSAKFYRYFFNGREFNVELGSPEFILLYFMAFLGICTIIFLKPRQEYLEATEANLDRSESDVRLLTSDVLEKKQEINDLKNKVENLEFHAEFRKTELSNALDLKNEFIRNLEHEGKTPITGITSLSEVLFDCYDQMNDQRRKETIKSIAQSTARLNSYVSNMVDLSKLQFGQYNFKPSQINLASFIRDRLEICKKLYIRTENLPKYEFKLELKGGLNYLIDPYYLAQIIDNLIINAIKHAKKGTITLKLFTRYQLIHFSVTDEGPGVPEEEILDIFGVFIISSRTRSPAEGRGVGLALCKQIIDIFGGDISVKNYAIGCSFTVKLPKKLKC